MKSWCGNFHLLHPNIASIPIVGVMSMCASTAVAYFCKDDKFSRPVDDKKLEFGSHKCRTVKYGLI